ncbi:MAG: hypothetical protein HC822_02800 [Oscillochloris sp.]|nr:hypothetical protein [Oscillochloris sp.]
MTLTLTPACLPLLRGGLPHRSATEAIEAMLAATPEIPAWPSLPALSYRESVVAQAAYGLPGALIDADRERVFIERSLAEQGVAQVGLAYLRGDDVFGALPDEYATGLDVLLAHPDEADEIQALKGELLGPVSLSLLLSDDQAKPLAYDTALREMVLQHTGLRMRWIADQLKTRCDQVLICLDEPFLDALNNPLCPLDWADGAEMLQRAAEAAPVGCGLIVGPGAQWEYILPLPFQVLVFDAFEHGADMLPAAGLLAGFLERGGWLAWGLIPADPLVNAHERPEMLAERFVALVTRLAEAAQVDVERISGASLITNATSLHSFIPADALSALQCCTATAHLIQSLYGFTKPKE